MASHTLAALTLVGAVFFSAPVSAQGIPCGPDDAVRLELSERYGEQSVARMLRGSDLVEVWVSEKGTWSITQTTESGHLCLLRSGTDFEALTENLMPERDS